MVRRSPLGIPLNQLLMRSQRLLYAGLRIYILLDALCCTPFTAFYTQCFLVSVCVFATTANPARITSLHNIKCIKWERTTLLRDVYVQAEKFAADIAYEENVRPLYADFVR